MEIFEELFKPMASSSSLSTNPREPERTRISPLSSKTHPSSGSDGSSPQESDADPRQSPGRSKDLQELRNTADLAPNFYATVVDLAPQSYGGDGDKGNQDVELGLIPAVSYLKSYYSSDLFHEQPTLLQTIKTVVRTLEQTMGELSIAEMEREEVVKQKVEALETSKAYVEGGMERIGLRRELSQAPKERDVAEKQIAVLIKERDKARALLGRHVRVAVPDRTRS